MIEAHQIAELFDRHARGLALYAAQWTELADDCVQEAFCELARQHELPGGLAVSCRSSPCDECNAW